MGRPMFLEADELQALMDVPNTRSLIGLRNRVIMGLMAESGLRVSEALALRPRDVNIREKRVEVAQGKNGSWRTVYFKTNTLAELLERWKSLRPEGELLFTNVRGASRGQAVSRRNIEKAVQQYARKAGLNIRVYPHMLRHSFATQLLRGGANLRTVQVALGHKNLSTTAIYTSITDNDVRQAMRGY